MNGEESIMSDGEKKKHAWEHAWNTDEIRKKSSNWTLAGDAGLLNHLQDFSHKLISRTMEMEKTMDSLVHKSKVASAKVNNVINDFQMLSNLQFVENRVYDEEIQEPEPPSTKEVQPKTKEQREAEMLPRIIKALELGVSVLDRAFERFELDESSNSEEEEDYDDEAVARKRTILEPKDLYEHRPLPYVIGTMEFQNDDYVGLRYTIDDEPSMESTQDENISSSSSSSSMSESEEELDDLIAKTEHQAPSIPAQHRNTVVSVDTMKAELSDSSDLFDGGEEENGYISSSPAEQKQEEKISANPLMEELMKKSKKMPSSDVPRPQKPESIQNPVVNTEQKKSSDDLFGGDGSDDEFFRSVDSPFQRKSLFSSNGVFGKDEKSDDENDLFADKPDPSERKPTPPKKVQVLPSPVSKVQVLPTPKKSSFSSQILDDEDDDLFSKMEKSEPSEKKPVPVTKVQVLPTPVSKAKVLPSDNAKKQAKSKKEPDLFGDDEDEGDDLFSSLSTQSPVSLQKPPSSSSKITSSESSKKSDKSTPSPSVSERSNKSLFDAPKEPSRSASLFGEDSDSEDLFSSTRKTTNPQKSFASNFAADGGLDDDEDGLFAIKSTSKPTKPTKTEASEVRNPQKKAPVSLFEESDSFDLFKPVEPKQKAEDLFSTDILKSDVLEKPVVGESPAQTQKKSPSLLFDESDSFDLFSPTGDKKEDAPKEVTKPKTDEVKVVKAKPEVKVPIPIKEDAVEKISTIKPRSSTSESSPPASTESVAATAAISFENNPSDSGSTLGAINKSRARIQVKRKKPTRKHRQARISADMDEYNPVDHSYLTIDAVPPTKPISSSRSADVFGQIGEEQQVNQSEEASSVVPINKSPKTHKKEEIDKKNLMSQLMFEARSSKVLKQTVPSVLDNDDDDDLFSSKRSITGGGSKNLGSDFSVLSPTAQKPEEVPVKTDSASQGPKLEGSTLLLSDSTSDEDLFSNSAFKDFRNSISKNSIFEDEDDDDIFKSTDTKDNLSRHSSEVLGEGADDIFAVVSKEKYEMFPSQVFDDDDDDDIFSNLTAASSSKKETPKEKPKTVNKPPDDIFDDPLGVA